MHADELMRLMAGRRSVRTFLDMPVPEGDIERMIAAATWAPSGSNAQNWGFVIVRSAAVKEQMASAVKAKVEGYTAQVSSPRGRREFLDYSKYYLFFAAAPVVVAVVKKPYVSLNTRIMERYGIGDVARSTADVQGPAAAVENLLLMAHALGYGACWMTGPLIARQELETMLSIQPPDNLMALVPVGKPAQTPAPPSKNAVRDMYRTL